MEVEGTGTSVRMLLVDGFTRLDPQEQGQIKSKSNLSWSGLVT